MNESIFRKSSLERISSPEQLNDYIKNNRSGVWIVMLALLAFMAGCCIWLFTGSIPDTVQATGVLRSGEIRAELSFDEGVNISQGMEVQVSPSYAPRDTYGYLLGTVSGVETETGKMTITVSIGQPRWSTEKGQEVALLDGAPCELTIVKEVRRPYELVL